MVIERAVRNPHQPTFQNLELQFHGPGFVKKFDQPPCSLFPPEFNERHARVVQFSKRASEKWKGSAGLEVNTQQGI